MISAFLCVASFIISFIAGRRSVVAGLAVVFAAGYAYGITRANLTETFSHFIFDAAVVGLYLSQFSRRLNKEERLRLQSLKLWLAFLMIWPALLSLIPVQDTLIELVGLRGNIFLLPFILIGARLDNKDFYKLAFWIAALNLLAFGFAVMEFFWGVRRFFPENAVTQIIYLSRDLINSTEFRIPASFSGAHAYGATMVMTLPLLVGAWEQKHNHKWQRYLLSVAIAGSVLGVFMAAARTHAVILFILLILITVSTKLSMISRLAWIVMLIGIGWTVSGEQRLQRFMTLQDTDFVSDRITNSVNKSFFDLAVSYPLGNGLGGGGTSIPYFLQSLIRNPVGIENEYARITLEQGLPGLCLWIAFLIWVFTRRTNYHLDSWHLGKRLAWFACLAYFGTGFIGIGLLTSIPQTGFLLLCVGWIAARQPIKAERPAIALRQLKSERQVLVQ